MSQRFLGLLKSLIQGGNGPIKGRGQRVSEPYSSLRCVFAQVDLFLLLSHQRTCLQKWKTPLWCPLSRHFTEIHRSGINMMMVFTCLTTRRARPGWKVLFQPNKKIIQVKKTLTGPAHFAPNMKFHKKEKTSPVLGKSSMCGFLGQRDTGQLLCHLIFVRRNQLFASNYHLKTRSCIIESLIFSKRGKLTVSYSPQTGMRGKAEKSNAKHHMSESNHYYYND